jgi:hypothetical protein
VFLKIFY